MESKNNNRNTDFHRNVGIQNRSLYCYLNTSIQLISSISSLKQIFFSSPKMKNTFLSDFQEALLALTFSKRNFPVKIEKPINHLSDISFSVGSEDKVFEFNDYNDFQEFFLILISLLENELSDFKD